VDLSAKQTEVACWTQQPFASCNFWIFIQTVEPEAITQYLFYGDTHTQQFMVASAWKPQQTACQPSKSRESRFMHQRRGPGL
jgi:hypothetical protein